MSLSTRVTPHRTSWVEGLQGCGVPTPLSTVEILHVTRWAEGCDYATAMPTRGAVNRISYYHPRRSACTRDGAIGDLCAARAVNLSIGHSFALVLGVADANSRFRGLGGPSSGGDVGFAG